MRSSQLSLHHGFGSALLRALAYLALLAAGSLLACGDDDEADGACVPGTAEGCRGDRVCEEVTGGEPACFAPLVLRGRVIDLASGAGVEGATVVALDVNGSARSTVVLSDDDGEYEIGLPVRRDERGAPVQDAVTLRVAAAGYQEFPSPPREALPIELTATDGSAGDDAGAASALIVMNAATEVGLIALPSEAAAFATIEGAIEHEIGAGALVVAVQGERAVATAIADLDSVFTLFNVPAGETRVEAYAAGMQVMPETRVVETRARVQDVVLEATTVGLARVSGSVSIVNAPGGLTTSVILVLESTFVQSPGIARGTAPLGLRVQRVSGAFEIEGVPPGKYAALAAFENDQLVRDPDEGIAGTAVVHIEVAANAGEVDLGESFKITEALAVVAPGASGIAMLPSAQDPTFSWADDSSEDGYELRVFDAFGELVHEALDVARVSGSETATYTWSGADLTPGMIYQFRVMSYREGRAVGGSRAYISATEDLRGVFQAEHVQP